MISASQSAGHGHRAAGELNQHSLIAAVLPVRDVFLAIFMASVGKAAPSERCSVRLRSAVAVHECHFSQLSDARSRHVWNPPAGMHLYPTFLLNNARLLILLTFALMLLKYAVTLAVRRCSALAGSVALAHQ